MFFSLLSASSARSTARFSSSSCTPNFLLSSSSFCSLSEAILVVARRFLSYSSIDTSLFMHLDSNTLTFLRTWSASLEERANLVTVSARFCSDFLASSSINMILRVKAATSASTSLKCFSFSSRDSVALSNLSFVSSNPISSCCTFFAIVTDVAISLIGHALVLLGGVLELADGGIQTVGLGLEALHLFSDCVHGYMLNWLSKLILMTYYLQAS